MGYADRGEAAYVMRYPTEARWVTLTGSGLVEWSGLEVVDVTALVRLGQPELISGGPRVARTEVRLVEDVDDFGAVLGVLRWKTVDFDSTGTEIMVTWSGASWPVALVA